MASDAWYLDDRVNLGGALYVIVVVGDDENYDEVYSQCLCYRFYRFRFLSSYSLSMMLMS